MSLLRRLILALALSAGLCPAFAAAPPPVPALPDAERRTSYSISGSTCACSVNFALYGDSTDYGNWIEVYLNGVLVPSSSYIISSPTGPLATIPRPINDAVLNFISVQTGTVQIVGARRPSRVSQFNENQGVAARDLNQALTDVIAQNRETWDRTNDVTGRVPRVPPGETQPIWPPASQRANFSAIFDASGNLVPGVSVSGSTFTAGNGISLTGTGPTSIAANLLAGTGISITGTNPLTITATAGASALYVRPQDFGAKCDGSTDDTTALRNMLNASSGKTIFFPAGPACVINGSLTPLANTTIRGAGRNVATIKQTGAAVIFRIADVSNVTIEDLGLLGTDSYVSWSATNYGAILITNSVAQNNLVFRRLKLSGFNANYWIYGSQVAPTSDTHFEDIAITTSPADIPSDANPLNNTNGAIVLQSGSGGVRWQNTVIRGVQVDGDYLCFGIVQFGDHYKYTINNNRLLRLGTAAPQCTNGLGATNSYGVLIYDDIDDGNPSSNGLIQNNYILNPSASGVYFAGDGASFLRASNSNSALVSGNLIVGQTSTDALLPRAAISSAQSTDIAVIGNYLYGNQNCVFFASQNAGDITVESNICVSPAGGSQGIIMGSGANGSSNTDRRFIKNNTIDVGATGILLASATGARFNQVELSGNNVTAGGGQTGYNLGGNFFSGQLILNGNIASGAGTQANISSITGSIGIYGGNISITVTQLPAALNGSTIFLTDGAPASSPCSGGSTGSAAFRQNGAWKCF